MCHYKCKHANLQSKISGTRSLHEKIECVFAVVASLQLVKTKRKNLRAEVSNEFVQRKTMNIK